MITARTLGNCALAVAAVLTACGDDGGSGDTDETGGGATNTSRTTSSGTTSTGTSTTTGATDGSTSATTATTNPATTESGATEDTTSSTDDTGSDSGTTGVVRNCDYETVDGLLVIEAESLPVVDDWAIETTEPGYYADAYMVWNGEPFNDDPSNGVISVTLGITQAGRYQLRWRNRIGMGISTTEHNDTWVKFPDAQGYYGARDEGDLETRRYPRPLCEDAKALAEIEALPGVSSASCVVGSSSDGWFKVYSSGASDWSWSTWTSDNDGVLVNMEFGAPGDYTMMLAARADFHLIDRIVIHEVGMDQDVWQAADAAETACR